MIKKVALYLDDSDAPLQIFPSVKEAADWEGEITPAYLERLLHKYPTKLGIDFGQYWLRWA